MKACAKCKQMKSRIEFSLNARNKDGLQSYCKPCHRSAVLAAQRNNPAAHRKASLKYMLSAKGKACTLRQKDKDPEAFRLRALARVKSYQERHKEKIRAYKAAKYAAQKAMREQTETLSLPRDMPTHKVCSACGVNKPLDDFYKDSFPRNLTGSQSRCKECAKANVLAYQKEHPEKKAASDKRYGAKTKDKQRERSARRRKENPDYWREYAAKYRKQWREANPEQEAVTQKRYRQNNAATVAERQTQYGRIKRKPLPWADRDKMRIVYAKAKEYGLEVDHIVPIRNKLVSGLHVWNNLQLLAGDENRRKKNVHWPDMP